MRPHALDAVTSITPKYPRASKGAGAWQSYDIWFTAPRWERAADGAPRKVPNARMTVRWNDVLVHDDIEVPDHTGLSSPEAPGATPILLQSHASDAKGPVRFRNVWLVQGAGSNRQLPSQ